MKKYLVKSCGHNIKIKADSVTRVGGVLELSRNENGAAQIIAWFSTWESCIELESENE